MSLKNITFEGRQLTELIKSKESIEDERRQLKMIREQTETIRINNHTKVRYKPRKERNGKVKKLGNREKNRYNYEKYMTESMRSERLLETFVIVMMAHPTETVFTTQFIADTIEDFARKNGFPVLRSTNHSLRGRLGAVRKSRLFKHMFHLDRNTPTNRDTVVKYGIKEDSLDTLTLDEAIALAKKRRTEFKNPNAVLNPNRSKKKKPIKPKIDPAASSRSGGAPKVELPVEKPKQKLKITEPTEPTKPTAQKDIIGDVIEKLKKLQAEGGSFIAVKGDLHIHININNTNQV